jgi:hypothetical protein
VPDKDAFVVGACIGLAVPGRPIGPWSRRTGAPEASATGRDRKALPRRLQRLAHEGVVTRDWPYPAVEVVANGITVYQVILRKPVVRVLL